MKAYRQILAACAVIAACGTAWGIDVTRPGDPVIASSGNHPAGEPPEGAIDNSAGSKYLNFDELNTGFTVFPSGTGTVRYLTIITANDAPERDPTTYILEGSNDGVNFDIISTGALAPSTDRFHISSVEMVNTTVYTAYRVTFPTVRNPGSANSMQIGEVQLATAVDITGPDDTVVITFPPGGFTAPNEGVDKLFDNRVGTKLDVQLASGPTTVDITPLAGATVVNGFSIFGANDDTAFPGRTPQSVTIFGTNDGVNFTQLFDTPVTQTVINLFDQEFEFANSTPYTSYRIVFGLPAFDTDLQIGEFQLFGFAPNQAPPSNDECSNPRELAPGTVSGTTILASGSDITACGSGDVNDVWYSYTASASGRVEVNTCESNLDTTLAVYSTCGSFMSGGFIWTASSQSISDWYDYLSEAAGATIAANYGPIGDEGDPNRGLPRLGYPTSISTDGVAIVGLQGGTQRIPGAASWLMLSSGGPGCVPPVFTLNPVASVNYSACSSSIILNAAVAGTLPISYQWQKNGSDLVDGPTSSGSVITGATAFQLRVNPILTPDDAGTYRAIATGTCGSPTLSSTSTVQLDPAFPPVANDTCAGAEIVVAGVNVISPAQSPCGAYINDPNAFASCSAGTKADRWFVFTPATSGNYRLETCGANYDTVMSVYPDCSGFELACNDNYLTGPTAGCTSTRSRISSLPLAAGVPYYIRIAAPLNAFLSDTSSMNLSIIDAPVAAANDTCAGAAVAAIGANAFDTIEATNDGAATCNSSLGRDVWFTFTPPTRGSVRLATCPGTAWNTVLSVLDSCSGNELACNDNADLSGCSTQSVIDYFPVTNSQPLVIRVATNSNTAAGGVGILTVSFRCGADFNADDTVNSQDFFDFLVAFFENSIDADFNRDNTVNSQDFFDFLTAFFAGC